MFVDESRRGSMYLLVAAVIPPGRLAESRAVMRDLQMPGERRIHFHSEHDSRRRKILAELVANGTQAQVYLGSGRPDRVRNACLDRLVRDAVNLDARRLVFESRGDADRKDRATIHRILGPANGLTYEHLLPHDDPVLAIPDAIAWAYGAGGDWRRRVARVVTQVANLGVIAAETARSPGSRRPAGLPGLTSSA